MLITCIPKSSTQEGYERIMQSLLRLKCGVSLCKNPLNFAS